MSQNGVLKETKEGPSSQRKTNVMACFDSNLVVQGAKIMPISCLFEEMETAKLCRRKVNCN